MTTLARRASGELVAITDVGVVTLSGDVAGRIDTPDECDKLLAEVNSAAVAAFKRGEVLRSFNG
jgi:hypothetical protein